MIGVGNQACNEIDQEVEMTTMARVFNLTNVLEFER
jgi:hypothetical protein